MYVVPGIKANCLCWKRCFWGVRLPNSKVWRSRLTTSESDSEYRLSTRSNAPRCGNTKTCRKMGTRDRLQACYLQKSSSRGVFVEHASFQVESRATACGGFGPCVAASSVADQNVNVYAERRSMIRSFASVILFNHSQKISNMPVPVGGGLAGPSAFDKCK